MEHYNIPVITVIFNNRTLGMVRQWQNLIYRRAVLPDRSGPGPRLRQAGRGLRHPGARPPPSRSSRPSSEEAVASASPGSSTAPSTRTPWSTPWSPAALPSPISYWIKGGRQDERSQPTRRTLSVLVENAAGVLSQVSRLFSRKGYNIESLAVGTTDDPSRLPHHHRGHGRQAHDRADHEPAAQAVLRLLRAGGCPSGPSAGSWSCSR